MAADKAEKENKELKLEQKDTTSDAPVSAEVSSQATDKKSNGPKKFYKRAWFWALLAAAVVLLGLGIFFGIRISQQNKNKQIISQGWHDLVLETNNVTVLAEKVTNQESYDAYSTELHKLDNMIDDKEFAAQKLAGSYDDVKSYKAYLTDFNRYITDSAHFSDNVANYTSADNDQLTDLSKTAKEADSTVKQNAKYLTENMNQKIYDTQQVLTTTRDDIVAKAAADKAKQAQAQADAAADAKNQQLVQQNVSAFLDGFVAGNAATMRQYMTPAFQNEYDFNQLTAEARQYTYPTSYRLLTTKKVDATNYTVQANVVFKNRNDAGQYTVGYQFGVINSSGKWLVNSEKQGSSY